MRHALSRWLDLVPLRLAVVEGGSMRPVLEDGDVVLVTRMMRRAVREGDVVVADVGASSVVKRVRSVANDVLELEGREPYRAVERTAVTGRVIAVARRQGARGGWRWRRVPRGQA